MHVIRSILRVILTVSIVVWCVGLMAGRSEERILYWQAATYALWGVAGAAGLLVLTLPFGFSAPTSEPRRLRRRASDLYGRDVGKGMASTGPGKCLDCGRPVVPGSDYCRYHTDLRHEERERGRY